MDKDAPPPPVRGSYLRPWARNRMSAANNRVSQMANRASAFIKQASVASIGKDVMYVRTEVINRPISEPIKIHRRPFHLFCSPHNINAKQLVKELKPVVKRLTSISGGCRKRAVNLLVTEDIASLGDASHMLVYLHGQTWTYGDASRRFAHDVVLALRAGVPLLLIYEKTGATDLTNDRHAVEFERFFDAGWTPDHLLIGDANIYRTMATPLKGGEFRAAGLAAIAARALEASGPRNPIEVKEPGEKEAQTARGSSLKSAVLNSLTRVRSVLGVFTSRTPRSSVASDRWSMRPFAKEAKITGSSKHLLPGFLGGGRHTVRLGGDRRSHLGDQGLDRRGSLSSAEMTMKDAPSTSRRRQAPVTKQLTSRSERPLRSASRERHTAHGPIRHNPDASTADRKPNSSWHPPPGLAGLTEISEGQSPARRSSGARLSLRELIGEGEDGDGDGGEGFSERRPSLSQRPSHFGDDGDLLQSLGANVGAAFNRSDPQGTSQERGSPRQSRPSDAVVLPVAGDARQPKPEREPSGRAESERSSNRSREEESDSFSGREEDRKLLAELNERIGAQASNWGVHAAPRAAAQNALRAAKATLGADAQRSELLDWAAQLLARPDGSSPQLQPAALPPPHIEPGELSPASVSPAERRARRQSNVLPGAMKLPARGSVSGSLEPSPQQRKQSLVSSAPPEGSGGDRRGSQGPPPPAALSPEITAAQQPAERRDSNAAASASIGEQQSESPQETVVRETIVREIVMRPSCRRQSHAGSLPGAGVDAATATLDAAAAARSLRQSRAIGPGPSAAPAARSSQPDLDA